MFWVIPKKKIICYTLTMIENGLTMAGYFLSRKGDCMKKFISEDFTPKEGMLYKTVTISGKTFDLYYGYYEEIDRNNNVLDVIYPDFIKRPTYTEDGKPIVTAMQDGCQYFNGDGGDYCCGECIYYKKGEELFGICTCPLNKTAIDA